MALADLSNNIVLSVVYTVLGGILGILMMGLAAFIVPKLVNALTPNIDEEKEILRGNLAVATYSGKITQAVIIGISIIIAAAIIAGI
jgi:uncharacterized membrane protein YjfL (UPF0719 family)